MRQSDFVSSHMIYDHALAQEDPTGLQTKIGDLPTGIGIGN